MPERAFSLPPCSSLLLRIPARPCPARSRTSYSIEQPVVALRPAEMACYWRSPLEKSPFRSPRAGSRNGQRSGPARLYRSGADETAFHSRLPAKVIRRRPLPQIENRRSKQEREEAAEEEQVAEEPGVHRHGGSGCPSRRPASARSRSVRSRHRLSPTLIAFPGYGMGATGLEPVTPSLSSWCSPN